MKLTVLDNEGKSFDRYTVIVDNDVYTMSHNPLSPQGVNNYGGTRKQLQDARGKYDHAGKVIAFRDLPEEVQMAVVEKMKLV